MDRNRQRKLEARANRQASRTARYGTPSDQEPNEEMVIEKSAVVNAPAVAKKQPEVLAKRRGRPPKSAIVDTKKKQMVLVAGRKILDAKGKKSGSTKKEKRNHA